MNLHELLWVPLSLLLGANVALAVDYGYDPGFEKPTAKVEHPVLPSKEILDSRAHVTCYEFSNFGVLEVDLGEIGAERLSLLAALKKGDKRTCVRDDKTGEKPTGLTDHYFWGVKGPYAFFRSADGVNGFSELVVLEGATGKKVLTASFEDPLKFSGTGKTLGLSFMTEIAADCSYPKDGKVCWEKMLKKAGVPDVLYAKAPDCPLAINEADGDKLPAAVAAPATVADLSKAKVVFGKGPLTCRTKD
jgi:hypothetical protein